MRRELKEMILSAQPGPGLRFSSCPDEEGTESECATAHFTIPELVSAVVPMRRELKDHKKLLLVPCVYVSAVVPMRRELKEMCHVCFNSLAE